MDAVTDEQQNLTKSRLGRGLASLMGDLPHESSLTNDENKANISILPIEHVQANKQNPRSSFSEEDLADLSNSIKEKGMLQPIIVREIDAEKLSYEVIAGERRWRAAQIAQLDKIPVIIKNLSDEDALEIAIIENVQRSNLNPIDEASGYKRLIDVFNYTQEDLSKVIGKSRSYIANILRLSSLPEIVKEYLSSGQITVGHARALILNANSEHIAKLIIKNGLSVRQTEELVKKYNNKQSALRSSKDKSVHIKALEKLISDNLGLKVEIKTNDNKQGKITISFSNIDQLENIKKHLIS